MSCKPGLQERGTLMLVYGKAGKIQLIKGRSCLDPERFKVFCFCLGLFTLMVKADGEAKAHGENAREATLCLE